jgi:hypothetical protein
MQQVWLALIGGIILGWLIEWVIDWQFWRRNVAELRAENASLRKQLDDAQAQLAAQRQSPPPTVPLAEGKASSGSSSQPARSAPPANQPASPPANPSSKGK